MDTILTPFIRAIATASAGELVRWLLSVKRIKDDSEAGKRSLPAAAVDEANVSASLIDGPPPVPQKDVMKVPYQHVVDCEDSMPKSGMIERMSDEIIEMPPINKILIPTDAIMVQQAPFVCYLEKTSQKHVMRVIIQNTIYKLSHTTKEEDFNFKCSKRYDEGKCNGPVKVCKKSFTFLSCKNHVNQCPLSTYNQSDGSRTRNLIRKEKREQMTLAREAQDLGAISDDAATHLEEYNKNLERQEAVAELMGD